MLLIKFQVKVCVFTTYCNEACKYGYVTTMTSKFMVQQLTPNKPYVLIKTRYVILRMNLPSFSL